MILVINKVYNKVIPKTHKILQIHKEPTKQYNQHNFY